MERKQFRAMGCQMMALLDTESPQAQAALAAVPLWFEEWEQHLSRFRSNSELMQLNERAGQPVPVSEVLWHALDAALDAAEQSDDLVTPTLLHALRAAGYDRSFDLLQRESPFGQAMSLATVNWRSIRLDDTQRTVQLPVGMGLDLGGTAKGWAADQAVQRLAEFGPALIDAGGDIAVSGPLGNGEPWPIAIADPFAPERDRAVVLLNRGGVATSGRDYRRWQQGGQWQHHIIDPRTQRPAQTDVLSATVIAPTTGAAEVGAKVAFLLGSHAGIDWLEQRPEYAGMLILEHGQTICSSAMSKFLCTE